MPWILLAAAIVSEMIGTLALRASTHALRPWNVAVIAAAYTLSICLLTFTLRHLKVGIVYSIWAGVGTAGVATVGALVFGDRLARPGIIGIGLIIIGVILLVTDTGAHHG